MPIADALDKISRLRGVEFVWNQKSVAPGKEAIGVIAQEVESEFPTAVITDKATGYKMVDYAVLVAPLIESVKELRHQKDQEISSLKSQNQAMKAVLCELKPEADICQNFAEEQE